MGAFVRALRAFDRVLASAEVLLLAFLLLSLVLVVAAEGTSRNAGQFAGSETSIFLWVKDALHWPDGPRVAQHLVLWVAMVGGSLAARDRRHISIEAISKVVTPQGRRVVEGIVDLGTVAVCVLLAYAAAGFVDAERALDAEKVARGQVGEQLLTIGARVVPAWWSLCILPVGLGLVGWRYALLGMSRIFVDEPVEPEAAHEIEEYEQKHGSGSSEREAAAP